MIEIKAESKSTGKENKAQKESKENIVVQKNSNARTKYFITVKTGNKISSGTDAQVTLIVHGNKASSQPISLNSSISKNTKPKDLFEKGTTDEFECEAADVGKVCLFQILYPFIMLNNVFFC